MYIIVAVFIWDINIYLTWEYASMWLYIQYINVYLSWLKNTARALHETQNTFAKYCSNHWVHKNLRQIIVSDLFNWRLNQMNRSMTSKKNAHEKHNIKWFGIFFLPNYPFQWKDSSPDFFSYAMKHICLGLWRKSLYVLQICHSLAAPAIISSYKLWSEVSCLWSSAKSSDFEPLTT